MSQYIEVEAEVETSRSASNHLNQTISDVVAIERYVVPIMNRVTIIYFLLFQEIKESPKKTQKFVDLQFMASPTQSASEKA